MAHVFQILCKRDFGFNVQRLTRSLLQTNYLQFDLSFVIPNLTFYLYAHPHYLASFISCYPTRIIWTQGYATAVEELMPRTSSRLCSVGRWPLFRMQRGGRHSRSNETTGRRDYKTQEEIPRASGHNKLKPRTFYSQIASRNWLLYLSPLPANVVLRRILPMARTKRSDWSIEAGSSMSKVAPAGMGDPESLGDAIPLYWTDNNELYSPGLPLFNRSMAGSIRDASLDYLLRQ